MKILQINKFFYLKGGSERYMFGLSDLLKSKGHDIAFFSMQDRNNRPSSWNDYFVKNVDYKKDNCLREKAGMFKNTLYSREAENKLLKVIDRFKPDIAHLHNFNHQLTPSILFALKRRGIPAVMTVHDYKLVCPSYLMLNHNRVCELCKGQKFYQCLKTKCHKDSYSASFLAALESYMHHKILDSYKHIAYFICPSKFLMNKMQEMGLEGNFIHRPYFIDSASFCSAKKKLHDKISYWGRLSFEKGIYTLIEAVKGLPVKLEIIGSGPLKEKIANKIEGEGISNIKLTGYLSGRGLFEKTKDSCVAVVPSEWYENNPNSILEAFALQIPVIGSELGGIPELVKPGETGLLFEPGNVWDLRAKIKYVMANPDIAAQMGKGGRSLMEEEYNPALHYAVITRIYKDAIRMKEKESSG